MARFTDEELRRYGRQMVLREVGGVGQDRLRSARVVAAGEVEALYLAGAGVGCVVVASDEIATTVRALNPLVRIEVSPQEVGELDVESEAQRALDTLRALLIS